MKKRSVIIILVVIILIGGFLRFYKLGNSAFDRDEFFELNSSYGYFKTGHFVAWNFNEEKPFPANMQDDSSNERAETFRWQLAQLYRFHEPTEFLTRALGSAWGVIGILLVFFITLSFTGNYYIALIAALLTAIGGSEIIYSRRLRMYAMFFPMYLLFSWTVFKFYESKYKGKLDFFQKIHEKIGFNPAYFLPVLITGLISYNVHLLTLNIGAVIAVYAFLFFTVSFWRQKKLVFDKYFITLAAVVVGLLATRLPIFYNYYKSIKKNLNFFQSNYDFFLEYFSDFIYISLDIILVIVGIWYLAKKMQRQKEAAFLASSALVPLALAVFAWKRETSHRYIYFLQSFGIILSAVGIYGVIQLAISRIKNYNYKKIVAVMLLIAFFVGIDYGYLKNNSGVYVQKSNSYYPDFETIFNYVKQNKKPEDVMITRTYRSFYWRGAGIKTYDIKSLQMGATGCEVKLDKIVKENPSGCAVYPKVDKLNLCSAGRKYYEDNFTRVKNNSIPSSVLIYRWGQ
ncbi:MAG: hypothetical protein WC608_01370 [Parcubacteria group bacterium]